LLQRSYFTISSLVFVTANVSVKNRKKDLSMSANEKKLSKKKEFVPLVQYHTQQTYGKKLHKTNMKNKQTFWLIKL